MSRYYQEWAPYVPVAERRRQAERAVQKLRRAGDPVAPVAIAGRVIATTFWGRAWCENMESYRDYESRLPRGRSYVRNGSVVDLQIASGRITALVSGSDLYRVAITIKETAKTHWRAICADCTGAIDSLVELLQGRFSKAIMERLCRQEGGLFPRPSDIGFSCSCPDHASLCKHVAAVLYGVGARLDHKPELLFRLRAVDETDLVARIDTGPSLSKKRLAADKALQADDISALFGLDIAPAPAAAPTPVTLRPAVTRKHAAIARRTPAEPATSTKAATEIRKPPAKAGLPKRAAAAQNIAARSRAPAVTTREAPAKNGRPQHNARVRATRRPA